MNARVAEGTSIAAEQCQIKILCKIRLFLLQLAKTCHTFITQIHSYDD